MAVPAGRAPEAFCKVPSFIVCCRSSASAWRCTSPLDPSLSDVSDVTQPIFFASNNRPLPPLEAGEAGVCRQVDAACGTELQEDVIIDAETLVAVCSDRDIPTSTGRNEVEDFAHMPADRLHQAEEVDVDVHDAPWESIYRVGR